MCEQAALPAAWYHAGMSGEIRRDHGFGRRYLLGNLSYVVPAAIAFAFAWRHFDAGGWRLWIATAAFVGLIVFGMVFDWLRFRNYRCPTCGVRIPKPTQPQFGAGTPRRYYCPNCRIEWDTGLRIPDD